MCHSVRCNPFYHYFTDLNTTLANLNASIIHRVYYIYGAFALNIYISLRYQRGIGLRTTRHPNWSCRGRAGAPRATPGGVECARGHALAGKKRCCSLAWLADDGQPTPAATTTVLSRCGEIEAHRACPVCCPGPKRPAHAAAGRCIHWLVSTAA